MDRCTEFVAFAIKPGMEALAQEWLDTLIKRHAECVQTLDREAMYYESIFRNVLNGITYLSWFSVQGSAGASVHSSPHPIDQVHTQFWDECVDQTVAPIVFEHIVSFLPALVEAAIAENERCVSNVRRPASPCDPANQVNDDHDSKRNH